MFMTREDWLVGRDRGSEAADRMYAAASELVSREGFEALTIEALAAEVHCSPATIYRHAGGKAAIREAVTMRTSSRIVGLVREAIKGLEGSERLVTAILVALEHIRAEPLGDLMMGSIRPSHEGEWLTASPGVARLAQEVNEGDAATDVAAVREIVAQEIAAFLAARQSATVTPTVVALRTMATGIVEAEVQRLLTRLPGLDPEVRGELEQAVRRVADKLLHQSTVRVKELANNETGAVSYAAALAELFSLDPDAVEAVTRPEGMR